MNSLSDKVIGTEKMTIAEDDEIIKNDSDTAKKWNRLFSNIIRNLNITHCQNCDSFADNVNEQVWKFIMKYSNQLSRFRAGK